jgi:hypothetical protein
MSTLDRELKKGSAELLILSLTDARARHGYEIGKLIETRSRGALKFNVASLYPLLYRLEKRGWIRGTWVEKARPAPGAASTASPHRDGGCSPPSAAAGAISSPPSTASPRSTMSDWRRAVNRRLDDLDVPPLRRIEIVEELTADAQDRYDELVAAGHAEPEARRLALEEIDPRLLAGELARIEPRDTPDIPGARRGSLAARAAVAH